MLIKPEVKRQKLFNTEKYIAKAKGNSSGSAHKNKNVKKLLTDSAKAKSLLNDWVF